MNESCCDNGLPQQDSSKLPPRGLVLVNLGTPDSPEPEDVRKYLKEFLMDPWVLDIPLVLRWMLVHFAILPKRPVSSGEAYKKVWTDRGSPLLFHSMDLTQRVQEKLGNSHHVRLAMRYGKPSMAMAFDELAGLGIRDVILFPLYPQYSLAATESSIQEWNRLSKEGGSSFKYRVIAPFYNHNLFIRAYVELTRTTLQNYSYDHVMFSFHGLPERQVKKTDSSGTGCFQKEHCCEEILDFNRNCYRAQCYSTAKLIAAGLGLSSEFYTVCFQSRLGRTPWLKPYSDALYRELPQKGIKRLVVVCPAFVADCLETLEEVQIRGLEEFVKHGGEALRLVPSLNSSPLWVAAVSQIVIDSEVSTFSGVRSI